MDLVQGQESTELFQAQSHVYNHIFSFISSMALKCAIQLGIPDIINNHGQSITLPELVSALKIHPTKTAFVHRLMRLLVHSGFFTKTRRNLEQQEEDSYDLTLSSRLLLRDKVPCLSPFAMAMLDQALLNPWQSLGSWFSKEESTITLFELANGKSFWVYQVENPDFKQLFNSGMASDSGMLNLVIKDCNTVFEGINSLVDVGGGTGTAAKIIAEAFPHVKCTVLDLPHVVADLPNTHNLTFLAGDMFQYIPPSDAILLKLLFHAFSDEQCLKVLKKCKESIPSVGGRVIIIDIVINEDEDEKELVEGKLYFDLLMMVVVTGKEPHEKEWKRLFLDAGFSHYQITPLFGIKSLIEVFP